MKYFSRIIMAVMASFPLFSCVQEKIEVGEPENENSYGVYFETLTKDQKAIEMSPDDGTELEFKAFRLDDAKTKKDEIVVPLFIKVEGGDGTTDPTQYFKTTELKFNAGQIESTFKVQFPELPTGYTYKVVVGCNDPKYIKLYSPLLVDFRFDLTYVKWNVYEGFAQFTDDLVTPLFQGTYQVNDKVKVMERADKPGLFKFVDVYSHLYLEKIFGFAEGQLKNNCIPNYEIIVDATNPKKVWIPTQNAGFMLVEEGFTCIGSYCPENKQKEQAYGKLENGVITFPAGGLFVFFSKIPADKIQLNPNGGTKFVLPAK